MSALERAGNWFLTSGIQEANGGVARYHLQAESRNLPVSTEITGYACSALSYLYNRSGDPAYLRAAEHAARFLTRTAWIPSLRAMPFEIGHPLPPAYFFDCGIIVRGLLMVHRATHRSEYLEIAREVGLFMGRAFRHEGSLHPIVRLPSLTPEPYQPRWSREPGCFLLKSAMAWDNLASHFPNDPFLDWYEEALAGALQSWEQFLPGDSDPNRVMDRLHGHGYFLEGLLPRAARPEVRATLSAAITKAAALLHEIAPRFERSDARAQLLRARLYAAALGVLPLDNAAAAVEVKRLEAHEESDGSFGFGFREGRRLPYRNPVSTAFVMQTLDLWAIHKDRPFSVDLAELI